jgi:hypothetical protein
VISDSFSQFGVQENPRARDDDLLLTEPALLHDASPLVVLYPEKLSFGWTKFRGAGQDSLPTLLEGLSL